MQNAGKISQAELRATKPLFHGVVSEVESSMLISRDTKHVLGFELLCPEEVLTSVTHIGPSCARAHWVKIRPHHEQGPGPPGRRHHRPHHHLYRAHRRRGQE